MSAEAYPNLVQASSPSAVPGSPLGLRCPFCRRLGTFHSSATPDLHWFPPKAGQVQNGFSVGNRVCPNPICQGIVFVILKNGKVDKSYPAELKEFDAVSIPAAVRSPMEEALKCESQQCYRAAALMIRRTLEMMCEDRGATGKTLADRINGLRQHIIVPRELLEGAHELRFLGNDAAHVEAKVYAEVGREEIEAAIDLAKALLHATYQTGSLVERLKALRVKGAPPQGA